MNTSLALRWLVVIAAAALAVVDGWRWRRATHPERRDRHLASALFGVGLLLAALPPAVPALAGAAGTALRLAGVVLLVAGAWRMFAARFARG